MGEGEEVWGKKRREGDRIRRRKEGERWGEEKEDGKGVREKKKEKDGEKRKGEKRIEVQKRDKLTWQWWFAIVECQQRGLDGSVSANQCLALLIDLVPVWPAGFL